MARPRRMMVLECIPQYQGKDEGQVLYHFLLMRMPRSVDYYVLRGKQDLLELLERKGQDYSMVHLSSHGRKEGYFSLAKGFLEPEEFPEGCFKGSEVTFSSCEVGRSDFMQRLHQRTGMRLGVAPLNDVLFIDAAMFFIHYYYFRCHKRYSARNSFDRTDQKLSGKVKGGFRFFEWR